MRWRSGAHLTSPSSPRILKLRSLFKVVVLPSGWQYDTGCLNIFLKRAVCLAVSSMVLYADTWSAQLSSGSSSSMSLTSGVRWLGRLSLRGVTQTSLRSVPESPCGRSPIDIWHVFTRLLCARTLCTRTGSMPTSAGSLTRVMDFSLSSLPVSIADSSGT
jgi:hypothetical protein